MNANKVFKEVYFYTYYNSKNKCIKNVIKSQYKDDIDKMIKENKITHELFLEIHSECRDIFFNDLMSYDLNEINKIMLCEMINEITYHSEKKLSVKSLDLIFSKIAKFTQFYYTFIYSID